MDKGGNFIGWLHVDGKNLSVLLVEEGLSTVHFTAESSKFYQQLTSAQEAAKAKNLNYWSTHVEEEKDEKVRILGGCRVFCCCLIIYLLIFYVIIFQSFPLPHILLLITLFF